MGQTIISAGLIVIVTIAVINANRLVINSQTTKLEAQARLEASDIAMEIITEARTKLFDEEVDGTDWQDVSEFTGNPSLGPEGTGETFSLPDVEPYQSRSRYDDFDDYKGYRRLASAAALSGYEVSCDVFYVTRTSPDTKTTSRTYLKKLTVYVTHPLYLRDTLRISMTKTH